MKMKKNFFNFFLAFFIALLFSCDHHNLEETSTTIQIPAEIFRQVTEINETSDMSLLLALSCKDYFERKTFSISEGNLRENGLSVTFEGIPSYEDGKVYVEFVENKRVSDELETYYTNNLATYKCTSDFKVFPNSLISVKLELKAVPTEETYLADFTLVQEDTEGECLLLKPQINFTENSTLNAPLPIGTTRWSVYYYSTYYGSFGEIIDVKNGLMNYKEFVSKPNANIPNPTFYLEATGEPTDKIKTPIVYYNVTKRSYYGDLTSMYEYLACNNIDEVQKANNAADAIFSSPDRPVSDYCFDNAGNLYVVYGGYVFKSAYDNKAGKYEKFIDQNGELIYQPFDSEEINSVQSLAYDAGKNVLYVLTSSYIYKYPNPAGRIYKNCGYHESTESFSLEIEAAVQNSQSWTAHNGKIYVAFVRNIEDENGSSYNLILQEYEYKEDSSSNTWTWTSGEDKIYPIKVNNTNLYFTTDIMYQDGSLYVIFRCYNTGWSHGDDQNYSTGGILKYDISSQTFDDDFRIKGFATESSFKSIYESKEITIDYFAPKLENETQVFYGPTKFVAIMPKKLVFLDQGADVEDKKEGSLSTKSRIVEYDLSTNSFSSKELSSPDLYFSYSYSG